MSDWGGPREKRYNPSSSWSGGPGPRWLWFLIGLLAGLAIGYWLGDLDDEQASANHRPGVENEWRIADNSDVGEESGSSEADQKNDDTEEDLSEPDTSPLPKPKPIPIPKSKPVGKIGDPEDPIDYGGPRLKPFF